jgi:hypothetical protein
VICTTSSIKDTRPVEITTLPMKTSIWMRRLVRLHLFDETSPRKGLWRMASRRKGHWVNLCAQRQLPSLDTTPTSRYPQQRRHDFPLQINIRISYT